MHIHSNLAAMLDITAAPLPDPLPIAEGDGEREHYSAAFTLPLPLAALRTPMSIFSTPEVCES